MTSHAPVLLRPVNSTHTVDRMSSCGEAALSRRGSIISDTCSIDQPLEGKSRVSESCNFTGPVDEILALIHDVYMKKRKISSKDMQLIDSRVHEMKNRIIDCLLPKVKDNDRPIFCNKPFVVESMQTSGYKEFNQTSKSQDGFPLPQHTLPTFAEITKRKYSLTKNATVILKTQMTSKANPKEVLKFEESVTKSLSNRNIDATLYATLPNKNGDIILKFDRKDDIKAITKGLGFLQETLSCEPFLLKGRRATRLFENLVL